MPKKKILYVATVDVHIKSFHLPYLKMMQQKGWETHVATNGKETIPFCDHKHTICMERSPFRLNNLKAIKQMEKLLEKEHFDIIHCHTPMGSVVTRLAAKKARKNGTRVIYTAHGFHFYTGAPLINWLLFYPVEWHLAKYTDTLITINHEDYNRAKKKFSKRCHDIQYVPGVGIDPKKFDFKMTKKEKHELRASLGLKDDDFVMIFPARLDKNKNQGFLIKCMPELIKENSKIHLLLPGQDELNGKYQRLARKLNVENNVHFLGKRNDVPRLLKISDLAVSSSKREGLPVNILEAEMANLPIVALDCRGCKDIIEGTNNIIVPKEKHEAVIGAILKMSNSNTSSISNPIYTIDCSLNRLEKIYFKKKRVMHILSSNKYSGAENVACTIINGLDNVYDFAYCSPKGDISESLKKRNIHYIPISKINLKNLRKAINEFRPDIIHAHDYKASILTSIINTGNRRIQVVSHIHQNNPKLRTKNQYSALFLVATNSIYKIIWVSNSAYDNYAFKELIKNKSLILKNVINPKDVLNKANAYKIKEKYDIIYLGRIGYPKNPMRFVEIVSLIAHEYNAHAAMVGDGPEAGLVEKEIAKRRLQNNIKFYGKVSNPFPILKNSKVLVMTSLYEGLPMAALEAQCLGLPIVATPTDGLTEIINQNENGYLSNDNQALKKKIIHFIKKTNRITHNNPQKQYKEYDRYLKMIEKIYA